MQAKLLRLLQDQEVMRVGSVPQKVDIRIMAASNTSLEDDIKKGHFKSDLYDRLQEAVIDIPPLREAPEMIPGIVTHFLKQYGAKYKKDIRVPEKTMSIFLRYQWPGNTQELKNTIQNLIMTCEADEILPQNLPPYMNDRQDA